MSASHRITSCIFQVPSCKSMTSDGVEVFQFPCLRMSWNTGYFSSPRRFTFHYFIFTPAAASHSSKCILKYVVYEYWRTPFVDTNPYYTCFLRRTDTQKSRSFCFSSGARRIFSFVTTFLLRLLFLFEAQDTRMALYLRTFFVSASLFILFFLSLWFCSYAKECSGVGGGFRKVEKFVFIPLDSSLFALLFSDFILFKHSKQYESCAIYVFREDMNI